MNNRLIFSIITITIITIGIVVYKSKTKTDEEIVIEYGDIPPLEINPAKTNLVNCLKQMRIVIADMKNDNYKDKITQEDITDFTKQVDEISKWLESNPTATPEKYEEQLKDLTYICEPIIKKLYNGANIVIPENSDIVARNSLQAKCDEYKNIINTPNISVILSEQDIKTVNDKVGEVSDWLTGHQSAKKEEFEAKQKELVDVCYSIILKLDAYGGIGPQEEPANRPIIEEVD